MSVIIKGMDMPTNCGDCYFEQIGAEEDEYGDTCISYCLFTECRIALSNRDDKILPSCPLVEIDDELYEKAVNAYVLQQVRCRNVDNH